MSAEDWGRYWFFRWENAIQCAFPRGTRLRVSKPATPDPIGRPWLAEWVKS